MDKQQLRNQIKESLKKVSDNDLKTYSEIILLNLVSIIKKNPEIKNILSYTPHFQGEIDLLPLENIFKDTHNFFYPVIANNNLEFYKRTNFEKFIIGKFGILEPHKDECFIVESHTPAIVLIPGLAFDSKNNRLGRGLGYYDKFLSINKSANLIKIGVCLEFQMFEYVPIDSNDIKMDLVLFPK